MCRVPSAHHGVIRVQANNDNSARNRACCTVSAIQRRAVLIFTIPCNMSLQARSAYIANGVCGRAARPQVLLSILQCFGKARALPTQRGIMNPFICQQPLTRPSSPAT